MVTQFILNPYSRLKTEMAKAVVTLLTLALGIVVAEPPIRGGHLYLPPGQGSPSNTYGVPSNSYLPSPVSQVPPPPPPPQYGPPSSQYGPPRASRPSNFGFAPAKVNFISNFGGGSGYRPAPTYGVPASSYGPPSGGGYKDDQSEPANYQFQYDVLAPEYNVEFGHQESRQYDTAKGTYYVLLPDGRKQKVDYTADETGYKPVITYTEAQGGGYSYSAKRPSTSYGVPSGSAGPY